ncbi:synaptic vesicle glycoprotein 2B-like [Leptopilina boulardi]|uniref:synaptic vesicle glycoprotein 2B-like n=1 Tax=Leptopilina boulardi TaxID=63433 RepID=UPI0021F508B7|nr:synaptic vesicle glycoprotein 2B-like [Leptopilina boulardi]
MQNPEEIVTDFSQSIEEDKQSGDKLMDNTREKKKDSLDVETITQNAIDATGFGIFNIQIALLSALVYANSAIALSSTSFILPAAVCDFELNTVDKGRIAVFLLIGTTIGTIIWGFVTDLKGRKYSLVICLFLQGCSDFFMSFTPSYWCFLFYRFLSGIGISGQITLVFAYAGEFQPTKFRKRILSWLDIAWIGGILLVPFLAWFIIPLELQYVYGRFFFRSWNLFILISSLPGLIIGVFLLYYPETPKFLANTKQYSKLLKVLVTMYQQNTPSKLKRNEENVFFNKILSPFLIDNENNLSQIEKLENIENNENGDRNLKIMLRNLKLQAIEIFKTPYWKKMIIGSVATFLILAPYNTLILWFPELLERFAIFQHHYPNESSSVCIVSQKLFSSNNDSNICDRSIHESVFIDTLWLSASCIPPAILLPLFVDKLGFKFFLVSAIIISSLATFGLFFVTTSLENRILSCIFESTNSIGISIIYCCLIEIFPTNFRILAMSVAILSGRIGSLVGNLIFSYFIDNYCAPVIITMSAQLFLGAILCLIL